MRIDINRDMALQSVPPLKTMDEPQRSITEDALTSIAYSLLSISSSLNKIVNGIGGHE